MAKARTYVVQHQIPVTKCIPGEEVELRLNKAEALALACFMAKIAGSPSGIRRYQDHITAALNEAGITYDSDVLCDSIKSGMVCEDFDPFSEYDLPLTGH